MRSTIVVMVAIFGLFGAILMVPQTANAQVYSQRVIPTCVNTENPSTCNNGGIYNSCTDYVNIGDTTTSEVGHDLTDWSLPIIHSGGSSYGYGDDGNFRMVIRPDDVCSENDRSAFFTLDAGTYGAKLLKIRHLDGLSNDDSFNVYINSQPVWSYIDVNDSDEKWNTLAIPLDETMIGTLDIEIRAMDDIWDLCPEFGQLAISWASLDTCTIPEPEPIIDLSIDKTVDLNEASPGDTLNYTIVVTNTGTADAFNVVVDDILPEGLIYQDGTTTKQWLYAVINTGASETINYVAIIEDDAVASDYTNIASVNATGFEKITAQATTAVAEEVLIPIVLGEEALPSLTIDKTANAEFANPGDTISYTIIVTNDGDAMAENVVLIDHIAPGMQFTNTLAPTYTWMLGIIAPGESITTTYNVVILRDNEPGIYTNTAEAWAQDVDNVFDTADIELRAVSVLGADTLPITGGSVMTFIYLAGAGLVLAFSGFLLKLTVAKNNRILINTKTGHLACFWFKKLDTARPASGGGSACSGPVETSSA